MACPWAKIKPPESVNLAEIMSEEVAKDLQIKENKKYLETENQLLVPQNSEDAVNEASSSTVEIPEDVLKAISDDTYENDVMIAKMLQMQFDKEYDEELKRTEKHYNGTSKVSVSFDNFLRVPLNNDFESDEEENEIQDIIDRKDWDRFDNLEREIAAMPARGYRMQDGKMVTKHDTVMNGRKNACKLLSFPPEFQTGDGEMFDLKLSNKVFNSLKTYSKHEQAKKYRFNDKKEDQATAEFGVDQYTRILLYRMINSQLLERVNGTVSIGKESVILHADSDPSFPQATEELPKECVIKVFKTILAEFKQRDKYIKDDHRFKDRYNHKQTSRKNIQVWAEKEMANLMRLHRIGINCPKVVTLKHHLLVMSFIGENHTPAPKLKDARMSDADYILAYDQVINAMKDMYEKANLIHADLSEYNILWYNQECYFIDVSQSVEPSHENAFHFLFRDCNNVINFFAKKGVPEIYTPNELFVFVTGCDYNDKISLVELRESVKMKPHLVDRPEMESIYNFNKIWDKAKKDFEGTFEATQIDISDLEIDDDDDTFDDLNYDDNVFDVELSNKAVNDLKIQSSNKKGKKEPTADSKKDQTMIELCRNQFIQSLLSKLITDINGVINASKDAIAFHAYSNPRIPHKLPKECVVKIYNSSLSQFKQWDKYIKDGDYFKNKFNKQVAKEIDQTEAEKEKDLLMRLHDAGIKCPKVITLKKGILLTSFIGHNQKPPPTLHEAVLTYDEYYTAWNQVYMYLVNMYRKANIVYEGLSEHHILWYNKQCYIVNVRHCIERSNENALNLLYDSVVNIMQYFRGKNKTIWWRPGYIFYSITECDFSYKDAIKKRNRFFKEEPIRYTRKCTPQGTI